MEHAPHSLATSAFTQWISYERDAAWTAKLAIIRAALGEDIAHFGECLREHNRHADELVAIARMNDLAAPIPTEPTFVTQEPFVIGAVDDGRALLEEMDRLEFARIDRYVGRRATTIDQATSMLHGLLDRHLAEARARLNRLRMLREWRRDLAA